MSYRKIDGLPIRENGTSAPDASTDPGRAQNPAPDAPRAEDAMVHRRRQAPAGEPLPITFRWMAKLPRSVRPLALLRQYPRIANMMAGMWPDPPSFRAYLHDLLTDRRGKRKGFPQEIAQELLALRIYYEETHPTTGDVYSDVDKRG